ncbi:hypothetical protein AB0B45_47775 [Nonomuraea sp. NPDC049152]|uniref:SCO4225 family membrane protein n=1 Tax=Nonomuraea sp. NPDC049152 TaxID=3154350 RepID=UPI0034099023
MIISSVVVLSSLVCGKDSVALWPPALVGLPLSAAIWWLLGLVPLEGFPIDSRWMVPFLYWLILLGGGLLQAWLLGHLTRHRSRTSGKDKSSSEGAARAAGPF